MSWQNVKLGDIEPNTGFAPIPEGNYKFQLLTGASTRERNGYEELVVSAAIVEGDSKGRRVFMQYPDPEATYVNKDGETKTFAWSAQALKKLEISLGEDQAEGETPVEYLNRVAADGLGLFTMNITQRSYFKKEQLDPETGLPKEGEEPTIQEQPQLFSVAPAA